MKLFIFFIILILLGLTAVAQAHATRNAEWDIEVHNSTICHCEKSGCTTGSYEPHIALKHIRKHSEDYAGICMTPTLTPTPTAGISATPTPEIAIPIVPTAPPNTGRGI